MLTTQENAFDLALFFLRVITQSQFIDYSTTYSIWRYTGRGGELTVLLVRYMVRVVPKSGTRLVANYTADEWRSVQSGTDILYWQILYVFSGKSCPTNNSLAPNLTSSNMSIYLRYLGKDKTNKPELYITKQSAGVGCIQPYHNRQRRTVVFTVTNSLVLWYSEISLTY